MKGTQFDVLTRVFAAKTSRRRVIGGTAAIAAAALLPLELRSASAQTDDAVALVQQFYASIDAYAYTDAYALYGSNMQSQQSAAQFEQGYSDTAFVQMTTSGSTANANGTSQVSVKLVAWHNDGSIKAYGGSYTVGTENGQLKILGASINEGPKPSGTVPLCTINQLSFSLGPWDAGAGSRMSSVVATNSGNASCTVGGAPRVIINDATSGESLKSTSEAGSPPVGITLDPGSSAHAPLRFSNWCVSTENKISLAVEVAGDDSQGTIDTSANGISYPPCLGENEDPGLGVQGFVSGMA